MTSREFYTKVIETVTDNELIDFAKTCIRILDEKNEKRRNTPTKEQKANEELMATIKGTLTADPIPASVIGAKLDISTQKASALLGLLAKRDEIESVDIKYNKRTVKGYKLLDGKEEE